MFDKTDHLSQLELLLLFDGELNEEDRAKALLHLETCDRCSAVFEETQSLSRELDGVMWTKVSVEDHTQQQERLKDLLKKESLSHPKAASERLSSSIVAYAAVGLLVLGLTGYGAYQRIVSVRYGARDFLSSPDPSLTPGDVRQVSYSEICPAKDEDKDPPVPATTAQSVFREYGLSARSKQKNFQVDYLISPQLGGTSQIRNLWPEPYERTIWNARVKDALEDRLHMLVCKREIELSDAQHAIATDWIGAYKNFFHTESPLQTQAMTEQ
ncbi:MAG: zf-HC2 domain-containing protein [Edaphobacter sp.]|uniref:anti-sigma factor family protein n=1 Tax=Edaphobacter sp. TaxID=1934404 RepID=UPI0023A327DE|nr:zf-HC2 domain-containing protein [Edaphobacter sp.]MDE1177380.1 zf-HC2 domain-containing protein [Edaphobacter sp.]